MAEVAIPMAALGIMYIVSNNKKDKEENEMENFSNLEQTYNNPNSLKDRVDRENNFNELRRNNTPYHGNKNNVDELFSKTNESWEKQKENYVPPELDSNNNMVSLTGEKPNFEHNNMTPFFGSNVTQQVNDKYSSVLDLYTGSGNQVIKKKEQAPLFAPKKNMNYINGAPNTNEFIKRRMQANISSKMSNVKPWQEIKVGPGLNKGYSSEGTGGFNSGMESRKDWMPKSVDELRVETNPKQTYNGVVLGAYAGSGRTEAGNIQTQGRVEKRLPDTYYINTPDRWFTTTGIEKAQKARSDIILQPENRPSTSKEHFGGMNQKEKLGTYHPGNYSEAKKIHLKSYNTGPANKNNVGDPHENDYSKKSYTSLPNSRNITSERTQLGIFSGTLRALMTPVLDVLKPTRKQNVIGNMRPMGNVQGRNNIQNSILWDPNDRPKTTTKEQLIDNKYITHGHHYKEGGYTTNPQQKIYNQRDSTTCSFTGNPSSYHGNNKPSLYQGSTYTHLNPNKQELCKVDRYNVGNHNLFNNNQNVSNLRNRSINPAQGNINAPKMSSNMSNIGKLSGRNTRERALGFDRNSDHMVSALKNNPYAKSFHSYA